MPRITESCVHEIENRADIVTVVSGYVALTQKGDQWWGCCPFHNERTPSFKVNPANNLFYCFGCKKSGGPIGFVMEMDKLTYVEALEDLAKKLNIPLVYEQGGGVSGPDNKKAEYHELYKKIMGSFHFLLLNHPEGKKALDYLTRRGLSMETIEAFSLGWAPSDPFWLADFLKGKGYSELFLAESGLFAKKNPRYAFFRDRVIFPIIDQRENVVGFGGRLMEGDGPKYLNSAESAWFQKGRLLYGFPRAQKAIKELKNAIICEGYMDVISLHQAGIAHATAPLGTAFTEDQALFLKRFTNRVTLAFDSDEAGQNAIQRASQICAKNDMECYVAVWPEAKDASEILEKQGAVVLNKCLENSISVMDYLVLRAGNMESSEGMTKAVFSLFPYIESVGSELKRDEILGRVARAFNVDLQSLRNDFLSRNDRKRQVKRPDPRTKRSDEPVSLTQDLVFMIALVANRSLYGNVRGEITTQEFSDENARILHIALEEGFRNEDSDEVFLSRIEEGGLKDLLLAKLATGEYRHSGDKFVDGCLLSHRIRVLERKAEEIRRSISQASSGTDVDPSGLNDLMYEKMYIDSELERLKGVKE